MIITAILSLVLTLLLAVGAAFAAISFWRFDRSMTWIAAGSLGAALLTAWFIGGAVHPVFVALVIVGGTALAVFGGGPAAVLALRMATRGSVAEGIHGGIVVTDPASADGAIRAETHEVLRGGTTIGVLERFATVASIIAGYPEALAVIVAVKGVGRFTELAAAEARERFIIGTLASLTWACLCGAIVRLVIA